MKLMSNLLLITGVAALAEAIETARAQGIGDDTLREVLGASPVVSQTSKIRFESVMAPGHPGWFSPVLARKDLGLAIRLAEEGDIPVRVGPGAEGLLSRTIDLGADWEDFSAVIEALRPQH
jgi:3-hydroxyisobutyrate dehydrogenase-like beta-hydroxyacid dehydrogenase